MRNLNRERYILYLILSLFCTVALALLAIGSQTFNLMFLMLPILAIGTVYYGFCLVDCSRGLKVYDGKIIGVRSHYRGGQRRFFSFNIEFTDEHGMIIPGSTPAIFPPRYINMFTVDLPVKVGYKGKTNRLVLFG